ncbi:hypothetical protein HKX48_003555 [Thoreauomyces humboldtii]|nr:hypothetical protein HKX48_003555 [Thoreauomyces humboldtii]
MACLSGYLVENAYTNATLPEATAFCTLELATFGNDVANTVVDEYGEPGVVLGASFPFVAASVILCFGRLCSYRNARACFLAVATLCNIVLAANLATGLSSKDENYLVLDKIGMASSVFMLTFTSMAGIQRFVQVLGNAKHRRWIERGLCVGLPIYGILLTVMGEHEISVATVHPTVYSAQFEGAMFIPTTVYLLGGMFCFSANLPSFKPTSITESRQDPFAVIKMLRLVNDIMMAIVMLLSAFQLIVSLPWRSSVYTSERLCLLSSVVLCVENAFEMVMSIARSRLALSRSQETTAENAADSHSHGPPHRTSGIGKSATMIPAVRTEASMKDADNRNISPSRTASLHLGEVV